MDEIKSESLDELIGTGGRIKPESVVAFDRITYKTPPWLFEGILDHW
jgi:hypothetical protein